MRTRVTLAPGSAILAALVLIVAGCTGGAQLAGIERLLPGLAPAQYVPNEVLVKFNPGADVSAALASIGGAQAAVIPKLDVRVVRLAGRTVDAALAVLRQRADVYYAEPNYLMFVPEEGRPSPEPPQPSPTRTAQVSPMLVTNDPAYPAKLWGLVKIGAPAAWDVTTGGSNVVVAVLDDGVDATHPDLSAKMLAGADCTSGTCFAGQSPGAQTHGTHVAGTAAAIGNNSIGIVGVAFSTATSILPVKVLGPSGGTSAGIAAGIVWARDQIIALNRRGVLNMSLGGPGYSQVLQDAVQFAVASPSILIVAAMGNDYKRWGTVFPAALPGVMAVGATDGNDAKADFSNTGAHISVTAPGRDVYSTLTGGAYGYFSGTSMASPHVAGLAALVWSANSTFTNYQVRRAIEVSSVDLGAGGWDEAFGWGRINAAAAVVTTPPDFYGCGQVVVQNGTAVPQGAADVIVSSGAIRRTARTATSTGPTSTLGATVFDFLPQGTYSVTASKTVSGTAYTGSGTITIPSGAPTTCGTTTITIPVP